jgi:hypothetical protein
MALGVPGEWAPLLSQSDSRHPLHDPSGYISEGNVLAIGVVPG